MGQLTLFRKDETKEDSFFDFEQTGNWYDHFGIFLKQHARENYPEVKTLSLFSGAGGLDIGFHDAGFNIVSAIEIEPMFTDTLVRNSGSGKYFDGETDVKCVDIREFHPEYKSIDFIIGGPPCQSFSAAGARALGVAGTKDDRGNLFLEYVRLLNTLKPKGFLFENVYRIVGANEGKDWKRITEAFLDVGYKLFYRILDTADYGVPQHRERLIIVGVRQDMLSDRLFLFPRPTHGPDSKSGLPHYSSIAALHGLKAEPVKTGLKGRYGHLLEEIPPGLNYSFFTEKMGHPNPIFAWRSKFSDFLYKADPVKPVRTIKAQGGQYTGPFHWGNRFFSVNELKRLQTFPDNYNINGGRGSAIHQIGNSVPPQFSRILALSILEQIFKVPLPITINYLSQNEGLSFRKRKRELSEHYKMTAAQAIKKLAKAKPPAPIQQSLIGFDITEKFGISTKDKGGKYTAHSYLENEVWFIDVSLSRVLKKPSDYLFDIQIEPKKGWIVPASKIVLRSCATGLESFTASWKVLDWFLLNKNIKADLVQLCGYYQYQPSFTSILNIYKKNCLADDNMEKLLHEICENFLTRRSIHASELCQETGLSKKDLKYLLEGLKKIGYEVRSSGTNISIEDESYLIPYAFPTLTPQSVQLNKVLWPQMKQN